MATQLCDDQTLVRQQEFLSLNKPAGKSEKSMKKLHTDRIKRDKYNESTHNLLVSYS